MKVLNAVNPTPAQIQSLVGAVGDGAIAMLNLLKFRETSAYEDANEPQIAGREAYMRYAREVKKLVEKIGGSMIYMGGAKALAIGEVEELWDAVAIVEYPSAATFVKMAMSSEMGAISHHRAAGLKGQLLVLCVSDIVV